LEQVYLLTTFINIVMSLPFRRIGSTCSKIPEFCECFQRTNRKILKFCDIRWLSRYLCIERLLEFWDTIQYFFNEIVITEQTKFGEPIIYNEQYRDKGLFSFFKIHIKFF